MTNFQKVPIYDVAIPDDHAPQGYFQGYQIEEDLALKEHLTQIRVVDTQSAADGRPPQVMFESPEKEQKTKHFPQITIKFLEQEVAHWREHRGRPEVFYEYLQNTVLTEGPMTMDYPIPIDLNYRVTTHARSNRHHAQIISQMAARVLHPRFAQMTCPGGTVRRIEVLSSTSADGIDGEGLRIFRMTYRLRIPTEIEMAAVLGTRVQEVVLDLVNKNTGLDYGTVVDRGIAKTDTGSGVEFENVQER